MNSSSGCRWLHPKREELRVPAAALRLHALDRSRPAMNIHRLESVDLPVKAPEVSATYGTESADENSSSPAARLSLDTRPTISPLAIGTYHPREGPWEALFCLPGP